MIVTIQTRQDVNGDAARYLVRNPPQEGCPATPFPTPIRYFSSPIYLLEIVSQSRTGFPTVPLLSPCFCPAPSSPPSCHAYRLQSPYAALPPRYYSR